MDGGNRTGSGQAGLKFDAVEDSERSNIELYYTPNIPFYLGNQANGNNREGGVQF